MQAPSSKATNSIRKVSVCSAFQKKLYLATHLREQFFLLQ